MQGGKAIVRALAAAAALAIAVTITASGGAIRDGRRAPGIRSAVAPAAVAPPLVEPDRSSFRAERTPLATPLARTMDAPTPEAPTIAQVLVFFDVLLSDAPNEASAPPARYEAAAIPPPLAPQAAPSPAMETRRREVLAPTAAVATPTTMPQPAPTEPPASAAASGVWEDAAYTQAVWDGVNARRATLGLAPLTVDPRLASAASSYARLMSERDWFSHTGPDGSSFAGRVTAAGFPFDGRLGEVLAMGSEGWPAASVVQAWMDSAPHREQLLDPAYRLAGVGCAFTPVTNVVRCAMEFSAS